LSLRADEPGTHRSRPSLTSFACPHGRRVLRWEGVRRPRTIRGITPDCG
jgi:hypothetical protein